MTRTLITLAVSTMPPVYSANINSFSVKLHKMSGFLLFVFAASHFTDLLLGDPSHGLKNPVLICFSNRELFLLVGIIELTLAICCCGFPSRAGTNVAILTFVALIVWYRWSFYYVGGYRCGCAGIIGKLFRVSKHTESGIAFTALICLVASTAPWLLGSIYRLFRRHPLALVLVLALMNSAAGQAETVIEVKGHYRARMYNPRTAVEYKTPEDGGFSSDAEFLAIISPEQTRIIVTNTSDMRWWAEYIFDGTNSYLLNSYDFHTVRSNALSSDLGAHASVSQSPFPIAESEDRIGIAVAWMTYGMRPKLIAPNARGIIEFSLPWLACRTDLLAFGFRWNITPDVNRIYVDHCEAVRDQSLDLDDEKELLRPELAVPRGNNFRNWQIQKLQLRRQWPTGFTVGRFKCDDWVKTNGCVVPWSSELQVFMKGYSNPSFRAVLRAKEIRVYESADAFSVFSRKVNQSTLVHDFRYRRVKMPRIFEAAEYTIEEGATWKGPDDPELIARAQLYLKSGPAYGESRLTFRHMVALCVCLVILLPLGFLLWRANKHNKTQQNK